MRSLKTGVAALAVGLLLNVPALQAQGAEFSLGGGVAVPTGDFDDAANLGLQGMAAVSFVPENLGFGFQFDGNYSRFGDELLDDVDLQMIYGTGNVVYKFNTSPESTFRPYLIGGGGVYNFKLTGDGVVGDNDSSTEFGINAGAGFDFKAGGAGLFIEGRFHRVFSDGSDHQFVPITVGIRFGGD